MILIIKCKVANHIFACYSLTQFNSIFSYAGRRGLSFEFWNIRSNFRVNFELLKMNYVSSCNGIFAIVMNHIYKNNNIKNQTRKESRKLERYGNWKYFFLNPDFKSTDLVQQSRLVLDRRHRHDSVRTKSGANIWIR